MKQALGHRIAEPAVGSHEWRIEISKCIAFLHSGLKAYGTTPEALGATYDIVLRRLEVTASEFRSLTEKWMIVWKKSEVPDVGSLAFHIENERARREAEAREASIRQAIAAEKEAETLAVRRKLLAKGIDPDAKATPEEARKLFPSLALLQSGQLEDPDRANLPVRAEIGEPTYRARAQAKESTWPDPETERSIAVAFLIKQRSAKDVADMHNGLGRPPGARELIPEEIPAIAERHRSYVEERTCL